MGQMYKISEEELLAFAKKLYAEACCGYFDLCESSSEVMVAEFLEGRQNAGGGILSGLPSSRVVHPSTWNDGSVIYPLPQSLVDNLYGTDGRDETAAADRRLIQASASEPSVTITETPIIRDEVFVRDENFVGNQSERI